MAPEIVKKQPYDPRSTDIWALGILAYRLLYGIPPFRAPSEKELYQKILKGQFVYPDEVINEETPFMPKNISEQAKDIISRMLSYQSNERPTAHQILQDPWLEL